MRRLRAFLFALSLVLPVLSCSANDRRSGLPYKVTVPAAPGFAATSYTYTLDASPSTVATTVPAGAGAGHLF